MRNIVRDFRTARRNGSLLRRMRNAQLVIVLLMLVPAVVSISLMSVFARQYHGVITHMDRVASLMPMVTENLLLELSDIVVGRTRFDEGEQFLILTDVGEQLDALIDRNPASRMELEMSRRTLGTLTDYVEKLGNQMREGSAVDEDESALDDIRNVAELLGEMLQDSIHAEVSAAADVNEQTQAAIRTTLIVEIGLLAATLLFAALAQGSLSRAIREPLGRLQAFAGRIAGGALSERAPQTDVEELRDLTYSLNTMAFKLQRLMEESVREQENLKKSELRALQAQITPHFLYNTLDAIVWLAEARRTSEVIEITRALSSFFRTSLNNGKDWITIEQEVDHLKGYLTIQKIRYRDILQYQIQVDETLYGQQVLKLIIQPLVENAIYHGIKNRRGGGMLTVRVGRQDGWLRVEIADNGAGMEAERLAEVRGALERSEPLDSESGYGLYSVDKRIKLYYGLDEGLSVDSALGQGTRVSFKVPLRGDANQAPPAV